MVYDSLYTVVYVGHFCHIVERINSARIRDTTHAGRKQGCRNFGKRNLVAENY